MTLEHGKSGNEGKSWMGCRGTAGHAPFEGRYLCIHSGARYPPQWRNSMLRHSTNTTVCSPLDYGKMCKKNQVSRKDWLLYEENNNFSIIFKSKSQKKKMLRWKLTTICTGCDNECAALTASMCETKGNESNRER